MSSGDRGSARVVLLIAGIAMVAIAAVIATFPELRARFVPGSSDPAESSTPRVPGGTPAAGDTPTRKLPVLPGTPEEAPPPELVIYRGEVSDALARSIPGVTVTAGAVPAEEERFVRADDDGRFEIGLPVGERPFVRIEAPGHPRLIVELESEPRVPYLLFRGGTIRGSVRGSAPGAEPGAAPVPLPGIRIEVAGTDGWWSEVTTDAQGRYSITAPQGAVVLTVRSPAHKDEQILDLEAVRDEETTHDLLLGPGIEVEAIVIADGAPLAGARVRVLTDLGEEASGRTDGIGRIVLGGLSPGNGRLVVVSPGYRAELSPFAITDGSSRIRRTVTLERCVPFTLEVVDTAGNPRPEAIVRIRLDQIDLVTAAAGDYHALQVLGRERVYSIDIAAADTPRVRTRYRAPKDGPPLLRVILPDGGRFRGSAVDPRGNPVAGAGVLIISLGTTDESWGTPQLTTTAIDGTFRSELLAPGSYRIQIHHPLLGRASVDATLVEGEDREVGKVGFRE